MKKWLVAIVFTLSFSFIHSAYAAVIFNEVMYYPSDGDTDWVEIYNDGSDDVLVKTSGAADAWRISTTDSASPAKYNLANPDFTIASGEYVILAVDKATFLSKHLSYTGNVVDITAGGFSNAGGRLQLYDNTGISISSVPYGPANGAENDGNSLQLISNAWVAGTPTPGRANSSFPPADNGEEEPVPPAGGSGGGSSPTPTSSSPTPAPKKVEEPKIKVKITTDPVAFIATPFNITGQAYGLRGEELYYGKYFWNFGDGDSKDTGERKPFAHTYFYAGEYPVTLEYYINPYSAVADATTKIIIKTIPLTVSISKVGDEKDFFIELSNNTDYEIDMSKWTITSSNKIFTLPKNTIIGAKKKIILPPSVTRFDFSDKESLKLAMASGQFVYAFNSTETAPIVAATSPKITKSKSAQATLASAENETTLPEEINFSGDLQAKPPAAPSYIWPSSLAVLLLTSGAGVYFIRKRKVSMRAGEDFEILDE